MYSIYSTPLTACQSATPPFNDQITKFDDVISVCVRGNIVCRNERDVIGKFDRTKTFFITSFRTRRPSEALLFFKF